MKRTISKKLKDKQFVITRWFRDQRAGLRNRFVLRSNKLTIHTLNANQWTDSDEKMLHACFQILVDFVECELPTDNHEWFEINKVKLKFGKRYPEAGIDHLNWRIGLKSSDSMAVNNNDQTLKQQYEMLLHLYMWWTLYRPNRVDPWSVVSVHAGDTKIITNTNGTYTTNVSPAYMAATQHAGDVDERHAEEDRAMLEKLMSVRLLMWN